MQPRHLVLCAALLAFCAKIYCAATTIGTTDAILFEMFSGKIADQGLLAMYREGQIFNHTPLVGEFSAFCRALSDATGIRIGFWLRLPGIVADLIAVLALLWVREKTGRPPWWALALFALSPVSFMISGYHGNVDSVLTMFLLLAAVMIVAEQPAWCGLCLGLAANVKIIPLLLVPAFFFYWWRHGRARQFAVPAVAIILAGWSEALIGVPGIFVSNVLGYSGFWGDWGISAALSTSGWHAMTHGGFIQLAPEQRIVIWILKTAIIGSVLAMSWRRRFVAPLSFFETVTIIWVIFFVLAPAIAPQYLVWFAPFLLLASPRDYAAITAASAIFLFVFYNTISHGLPWNRGISTSALAESWRVWANLPWLAMIALLINFARRPVKAKRVELPAENLPALAAI